MFAEPEEGGRHALEVLKVALFEERRVRKRTGRHRVLSQFITDIRRPEAVSYASELGFPPVAVDGFDLVDPFGDGLVCKSSVFALPGPVVEVWVRVVVPVLAVLPYRVLYQESVLVLRGVDKPKK